jgi:hypothetical protein
MTDTSPQYIHHTLKRVSSLQTGMTVKKKNYSLAKMTTLDESQTMIM